MKYILFLAISPQPEQAPLFVSWLILKTELFMQIPADTDAKNHSQIHSSTSKTH